MRRTTIALALCVPLWSAGQICGPREYEEIKDSLRTADGRLSAAFGYCQAKVLGEALGGSQGALCRSTMQKTMTAMETIGDTAAVGWARSGCKGTLPPRQ